MDVEIFEEKRCKGVWLRLNDSRLQNTFTAESSKRKGPSGMAWFTQGQFLIVFLLESPPKAKKRRVVVSDEELEDDTPADPGEFGLPLSYFLWQDSVEPRRASKKPPSDDSRSSKSIPQSPKSRGKRKEVVPASPKVTQAEDDEVKSSSSEDEGGEFELVEEEEVGRMLVSSAASKRFIAHASGWRVLFHILLSALGLL